GTTILADDGSPHAAEARALLARIPALAAGAVEVVSVAHVTAPIAIGVAPTMRDAARAAHASERARALEEHQAIARRGSDVLRASGIDSLPVAREGDPTDELLTEARIAGADLIVIGTRGRTGLERIVLGSVARKVLTSAPCSVLVVPTWKGD
ncbi:MAG TPA: universal stress protein, partial [Candidatus Limnocylindria bacterium]|nr:universal stress protein [Candidatus Limnocylindria bacterium]